MSRAYTPTSKVNPCPICDDTSGKCRTKDDGGKEFILCMNFGDSKFGEIINGYKCIKEASPNKSYFGSTWTIDNSKEWTEQQKAEWERRKAERSEHQAREMAQRKRRSLSPVERDKGYREIFAQLELHPDDREDLKRRGFTDKQIESSGFKSVQPHQFLKTGVNPNLPGVTKNGSELVVKADGYLIPVKNVDGLIVGCQVRLRTPIDGNRYLWLSSRNVLHLFPDGSTQGELPLAVHRPQGKPLGLALVEGTGAKPFLVANRLNRFVIGAAGGQWTSSRNIWGNTLEKLGSKFTSEEIAIYPDAGDILNPSVMNRWERVINQLIEWGYKPVVKWWNQVTKDDCDIDELSDYSQIKDITPKQFSDIAKEAQEEVKNAEKERQQRLKAEAEEAIYQSLTTITEKPWLEVNEPLLNLIGRIEPGAIYVVASPKGTGKTQGLISLVPKFNSVYGSFNRIALGREECHKIGLDYIDDLISPRNSRRIGSVIDSNYKISPEMLANIGLYLSDEFDQVAEHSFGDTCNKDGKRPIILNTFEAQLNTALAGGGAGLFMSADITQKEIDYLKALAPVGTPVRVIINHYKPEKCTLHFDESKNFDGLIEVLIDNLENGIPTFVIDDIKNGVRGCKSIAEYVRTLHPEWANQIKEINSDTSGDPETIAYIKNINEASKNTLLLCCSPSVVSGISLTNGRFNQSVFGFFHGVLTVSQASQALSRVRGAQSVCVWAAEQGLVYAANRATDPREINNYYQRNYEANSKHIQAFKPEYEPLKHEWLSPHWELYCKNAAYRNLCMNQLRERLKAKLEAEGYEIVIVNSDESREVEKGLKASWSKVELDYAESLNKVEIFSDNELDAINYQSTPLTPEEKLRFDKTILLKQFGEELITATTFIHKESGKQLKGYPAMYLKNERGVYQQQLNNFHLLTSPIEEAINQDIARENRQLKHGFGRFPGDIRWKARQFKARDFLGLDKFLDPQKWTTANDYRELAEKARKHARLVKDALGVNVERIKYDSQIFTELMEQLGLKLDDEWVEDGITADGKRRRYKQRRINAESWQHAQMYVAYRQSLKAEAEAKQEAYEESRTVTEAVEVKVEPVEAEVEPVQLELLGSTSSPNQFSKSQQTELMDRPPLNLYTESFLGGGRSIAQSQTQQEKDAQEVANMWLAVCDESDPVAAPEFAKDIYEVMGEVGKNYGASFEKLVWGCLDTQQQAKVKLLLEAVGCNSEASRLGQSVLISESQVKPELEVHSEAQSVADMWAITCEETEQTAAQELTAVVLGVVTELVEHYGAWFKKLVWECLDKMQQARVRTLISLMPHPS